EERSAEPDAGAEREERIEEARVLGAARALDAVCDERPEERGVRREHRASLRAQRRHDAELRGLLRSRAWIGHLRGRREEVAEEDEAAYRDVCARDALDAHAELLAPRRDRDDSQDEGIAPE